MSVTLEQLKVKILTAPDDQFAVICAAVDERRGGETVDLADKMMLMLRSMSVEKLTAGMERGLDRGDASMFRELLGIIKEAESGRRHGDVTVSIEHYTVPDVAIPHIIEHCADEQYKPIEAAVFARRDKRTKSRQARRERADAKREAVERETLEAEERMKQAQEMVESQYEGADDTDDVDDEGEQS
jgi:hypothetical protein